jgi:hypothetical protein
MKTIGEKYRPAMKITDPEEARRYFEELVRHNMANSDHTRKQAEDIERSNLGYFAGYYDKDTRIRVERLFYCVHPVFGSAKKNDFKPEEVFAMGLAIGSGVTFIKDEKAYPEQKDEKKARRHQ